MDDWEKLEFLLKHHDWNYQFSDDYRVWSSGQRNFETIKTLRLELGKSDAQRAEKLWLEYCK